MCDFIKANFDKLLLVLLLLILVFVALHIMHDGGDMKGWDWIETLVGNVLGALLILITGNRYRQSGKTDEPKDPSGDVQ